MVVEPLALVCELAMLVLLVIAGAGLAHGVFEVVLPVLLVGVVVLVWARFMAPTSSSRLADPARLSAQVALFASTAALVVAAGHLVLGVGFFVVAVAVFSLSRLGSGVTGSPPNRLPPPGLRS